MRFLNTAMAWVITNAVGGGLRCLRASSTASAPPSTMVAIFLVAEFAVRARRAAHPVVWTPWLVLCSLSAVTMAGMSPAWWMAVMCSSAWMLRLRSARQAAC